MWTDLAAAANALTAPTYRAFESVGAGRWGIATSVSVVPGPRKVSWCCPPNCCGRPHRMPFTSQCSSRNSAERRAAGSGASRQPAGGASKADRRGGTGLTAGPSGPEAGRATPAWLLRAKVDFRSTVDREGHYVRSVDPSRRATPSDFPRVSVSYFGGLQCPFRLGVRVRRRDWFLPPLRSATAAGALRRGARPLAGRRQMSP